jgi:hypothetical protein
MLLRRRKQAGEATGELLHPLLQLAQERMVGGVGEVAQAAEVAKVAAGELGRLASEVVEESHDGRVA